MSICTGENCMLCRNIMPEWREIVKLKRDVIDFVKGEDVFKQGDTVNGIYFILKGKLKIHMSWGNKSYIARLAGEGDILGHRGFGLDQVYPVTATVLEDATVCFIDLELFQTLLKTNIQLSNQLLWFFADELKLTERRMRHLAHMPVKGRIAESLLLIRRTFGLKENKALGYTISRKDIAAMSGATYETVVRTLSEFAHEKVIKLEEKEIILLDIPRIESCCKELELTSTLN